MTAHECEEYIEEPPQRKRYAFRKPERQRDFLRLKLTLPSERRTGKPPPDPLLVLCRLQAHRGSRCSTVTKIPDTTTHYLSTSNYHMLSYISFSIKAKVLGLKEYMTKEFKNSLSQESKYPSFSFRCKCKGSS